MQVAGSRPRSRARDSHAPSERTVQVPTALPGRSAMPLMGTCSLVAVMLAAVLAV